MCLCVPLLCLCAFIHDHVVPIIVALVVFLFLYVVYKIFQSRNAMSPAMACCARSASKCKITVKPKRSRSKCGVSKRSDEEPEEDLLSGVDSLDELVDGLVGVDEVKR